MAQLTFWVDGWPFRVHFSGTIDIERLSSGEVACRRVTPDTQLYRVVPDEEELARHRAMLSDMRRREKEFDDKIRRAWAGPPSGPE